jgi:hypothetical protein
MFSAPINPLTERIIHCVHRPVNVVRLAALILRSVRAALASACLLCLSTCSVHVHPVDTEVTDAAGIAAQLPAPSQLPSRPKAASTSANGSNFEDDLPFANTADGGNFSAVLSPEFPEGSSGLAGLAYAIYELGVPASAADDDLVFLDWQGETSDWFVGLENEAADTWEWFQTVDGLKVSLPLEIAGELDSIFLVVALVGTQEQVLDRIRIGGTAPHVEMTVNLEASTVGRRPLAVFLSAQAEDSNGDIVKYEWNVDTANPDFEIDTATQPSLSAIVIETGQIQVGVRVTDDDGETAADTVLVDTTASWHVQAVTNVPAGVFCHSPSMTTVDDRPAIAYSRNDVSGNEFSIEYVRATDEEGVNAWGEPVRVTGVGQPAENPELLFTQTAPVVLFHDDGDGSFLLSQLASDVIGDTWSTPPILVAENCRTFDAVLDSPNTPVVAYQTESFDLHYIRSDGSLVSAWGPDRIVDESADNVAFTLSLNNLANAVAYDDVTNLRLLYAKADDSLGTSWGPPEVISDSSAISPSLTRFPFAPRPNCFYLDDQGSAVPSFTRVDDNADWLVPPGPGQISTDAAITLLGSAGMNVGGGAVPCMAYAADDGFIKFLYPRGFDLEDWPPPETVHQATSASDSTGSLIQLSTFSEPMAMCWANSGTGQIEYAVYF